MAAGIAAAITAVFTVLAMILEAWAQNSPRRTQEAADAAQQKGRHDLEMGAVDDVSVRIDRVLTAAAQADGGNAGSADRVSAAGATITADRLRDFDIRLE